MKSIILMLTSFMLSGCGILVPKDLTPEDRQKIVFEVAKTTTSTAILTLDKDDTVKQSLNAAKIVAVIDIDIMPILNNNDSVITGELIQEFVSVVPAEYRPLMSLAFTTLSLHFTVPGPNDILTLGQVSIVRAFVAGIREGANYVLLQNGAILENNVRMTITPSAQPTENRKEGE